MTVSPQLLSLSVVLATFNEKDNLGPMLEQLKGLLGQRYQLELVVVLLLQETLVHRLVVVVNMQYPDFG